MQATCTSLALAGCVLLALTCCLVPDVAPSSSPSAFHSFHTAEKTRPLKQQGNEEYNRLRNALQLYGYRPTKTYINHFQSSAKCPFRVLRARGFTRIMCDFTGCYNQKDGPCLSDCQQAYMSTRDLRPRKPKMTRGVFEEIEMGCIYTPKQSAHSVETTNAGPYVVS